MRKILDSIQSPQDLKSLTAPEHKTLCGEIRTQLLARLSITGGHVGSNLAVVEATVALHTVLDTPKDKLIFDVSHQCYTHKMLTGRKSAYTDPVQYGTVSGFTNPAESEYDLFAVGHTSTAVSLAFGLAKARDAMDETYRVAALVGDGALSGGLAYEGLSNLATLNSNCIILLNDNGMSIAENHGGIYENLRLLRESGGNAPCNLFRALGLAYRFVPDGNDVEQLVSVLEEVKDLSRPVVIHMVTVKGKGYLPAETNQEYWHFSGPFDLETGASPASSSPSIETYEALTRDYLSARMADDPALIAVTAGTPKVLGFEEALRQKFPRQFVDVGIAEGHAVTAISAMAKAGAKPVFGVSSSFLPRAFDQLSHDLALNRCPAIILVFLAGISYGSQTHMGIFDLAFTASIPNLTCLSPTCREEYLSMLDWALSQKEGPVIIRVPGINTVSRAAQLRPAYNHPPKYELAIHGTQVAILALGDFFPLGEQVRQKLEENGIHASLINPRCTSCLDEATLSALPAYGHQLVVTLEDGVLTGGFGEQVARFYGPSSVKVLSFGARKEFTDWTSVEEQHQANRLTAGQITADILALL